MLHSSYGINSNGNFTLSGADTVALAKKYGTYEDASFINGVLGAIAKA